MSIMFTIFDVSIKEERFHGSLRFELLLQQISQSEKKYIDWVSMQISTSRSYCRPYLERLVVFRE